MFVALEMNRKDLAKGCREKNLTRNIHCIVLIYALISLYINIKYINPATVEKQCPGIEAL